jgi:hypothetical protein
VLFPTTHNFWSVIEVAMCGLFFYIFLRRQPRPRAYYRRQDRCCAAFSRRLHFGLHLLLFARRPGARHHTHLCFMQFEEVTLRLEKNTKTCTYAILNDSCEAVSEESADGQERVDENGDHGTFIHHSMDICAAYLSKNKKVRSYKRKIDQSHSCVRISVPMGIRNKSREPTA